MNIDQEKIATSEAREAQGHVCNEMCLDDCAGCDDNFCIDDGPLIKAIDGLKYCPGCFEKLVVAQIKDMVSIK